MEVSQQRIYFPEKIVNIIPASNVAIYPEDLMLILTEVIR